MSEVLLYVRDAMGDKKLWADKHAQNQKPQGSLDNCNYRGTSLVRNRPSS